MRSSQLFFLATLLAFCAPKKIISNKDPSFSKEIRKVFVVFRGTEDGRIFFEGLSQEVKSTFIARNVDAETYLLIDGLSTSEEVKEINRQIDDYFPDVVMRFNQEPLIGKTRGLAKPVNGTYLGVQLNEFPEGPVVWQAFVELSAENVNTAQLKEQGEMVTNLVFKTLERDKLIPAFKR